MLRIVAAIPLCLDRFLIVYPETHWAHGLHPYSWFAVREILAPDIVGGQKSENIFHDFCFMSEAAYKRTTLKVGQHVVRWETSVLDVPLVCPCMR